jgi:hypothetical protein
LSEESLLGGRVMQRRQGLGRERHCGRDNF